MDSETLGVSIILKWTPQIGASYDIIVVPVVDVIFIENISANLSLLYNTSYNVSVIAKSICGQASTTFELNYGEK